MTLEIVVVPCLTDNYAYLIRDSVGPNVAVVDVPDARAVTEALDARGWVLDTILITHHHDDHIMGVPALAKATGAKVYGAQADAARLPALDVELADGATFSFGSHPVEVMDVSGHTVGHIAYHFPQAKAVFTGDSLMALGCGRLFEGTATMMWDSLSKLAALPVETMIYSGHEYTQSNARFAQSIDPANPELADRAQRIDALRAANQPTIPVTLAEELATNPFMRVADPGLRTALGLEGATDADVFAEIRRRKDAF